MSRHKHDTVMEAVLAFLEEKGEEGARVKELVTATMADVQPQDRGTVLQALIGTAKVKVFVDNSGDQWYKLSKEPPDTRMQGLNKEDIMVFQRIKEAGNKGIWTRDLKIQTNLAQPQITKILKVLEGANLVKSVKSVANPSRKLYILADIEPAREITGGAWYSDNQFDRQFVNILREACFKRIAQDPHPRLSDISEFIRRIGVSRVALQDEDIQQVVNTLVYDGRVEQIEGEQDDTYRPAVLQIPEATAFSSMPCGICPVFDHCTDGGEVSPQTCVYFKAWLEL